LRQRGHLTALGRTPSPDSLSCAWHDEQVSRVMDMGANSLEVRGPGAIADSTQPGLPLKLKSFQHGLRGEPVSRLMRPLKKVRSLQTGA
jgi:hypothetical protein